MKHDPITQGSALIDAKNSQGQDNGIFKNTDLAR
jgi:hypothetical protein